MTRVRLALALLMMGASGATANAAETHPFNVRDMQGMDRVSEPRVSPDGKQIVFVVTTTDLDANKHASSLWRMHTDGTGLLRLTSTPAARDSSPRWSPDGASIYFLSSRTDPAQVWRISLAGGEAEKVTDEPLDVDNLAISPDGTKIAYSMDAFVDCSDAACTKKRLDELAAKKSSGKVYDSLLYRHWDSWSNGTRTHLFVRDVKGGASKDVTKGVEADVPSKPFGGPEEYTFTPDSKSIVYAARVAGREEAWSTNFDLFEAPIDGSAPARNLTAGNLATDTQPSFSPDGKTLAYLAMSRAGFESDRLRVVLKP